MEEAEVVDVISTRFQMSKSEKAKVEASEKDEDKESGRPLQIVRPLRTAGNVKKGLEGWRKYNEETEKWKKTPNGVIVFNPNTDNSLLMRGRPGGRQCHLAAQLAQGARPRQEDGRPLRADHRSRRPFRNAGGGGEHGGG